MFFEWEDTESFDRKDSYFAQIALEVRRVLSNEPGKYKLSDFLLKFESAPSKAEEPEPDDQPNMLRTMMSKSFWMGLVGMTPPPPQEE